MAGRSFGTDLSLDLDDDLLSSDRSLPQTLSASQLSSPHDSDSYVPLSRQQSANSQQSTLPVRQLSASHKDLVPESPITELLEHEKPRSLTVTTEPTEGWPRRRLQRTSAVKPSSQSYSSLPTQASTGETETDRVYEELTIEQLEEKYTSSVQREESLSKIKIIVECLSGKLTEDRQYTKALHYFTKLHGIIKLKNVLLDIGNNQLDKQSDLADVFVSIADCHTQLGQVKLALYYYGRANEIYEQIGESKSRSSRECLVKIGQCYYRLGEYHLAISYVENCDSKGTNEDLYVQSAAFNVLGKCHRALGSFQLAIKSHERELSKRLFQAQAGKSDFKIAESKLLIASIKIYQKNFHDAQDDIGEARQYYTDCDSSDNSKTGKILGHAASDNLEAICLSLQKKHETALERVSSSVNAIENLRSADHGIMERLSDCLHNKGVILSHLERYTEALKVHSKEILIRKQLVGIGFKVDQGEKSIATSYCRMGLNRWYLKDYDLCLKELEQCQGLLRSFQQRTINNPHADSLDEHLAVCYFIRGKCFEKLGKQDDMKSALNEASVIWNRVIPNKQEMEEVCERLNLFVTAPL